MGAGNGDNYINEIKKILNISNQLTPEISAKLHCIVQMAMAFEWENLPTCLEQFNGLYLKYLRLSHVIAHFEIGDKHGVVSHGGFPKDYKLTSPFGFLDTTPKFEEKVGFKTILNEIEFEKNDMCDSVQGLRDIGINDISNPLYNLIEKYVHLTALTELEKLPELENIASSKASPIVGMQPVKINNRQRDISLQLGGATQWIIEQADKGGKQVETEKDAIIFDYDIFGHAPQGFLPTAYRYKKTLYVNLDISKADGPTNTNTFGMLNLKYDIKDDIKEDIKEFVGKITLTDNEKTTEYKKSSINRGFPIYYIENISLSEYEILGNNRKIPNIAVDISISYNTGPPFKRYITNTRINPYKTGGRRKKTRRMKKRKNRKTKVRGKQY